MNSIQVDQETKKLISELPERMIDFLSNWAENMEKAGYLQHTTAKVEDCVLSFKLFIDPLFKCIEKSEKPARFERLIHEKDWAISILETARRHRLRGITAEMFFGCLKTLTHAVEQLVFESSARTQTKLTAVRLIRLYADAFETHVVGDWTLTSEQESRKSLDQSNRTLTLEKNKYENILSSISDLVITIDKHGSIIDINQAALNTLGPLLGQNKKIWEILGLEGESMEDLNRYYPMDKSHEISLFDDNLYLNLKIIPLSMVSLASHGYIMVLNNITHYVNQRMVLEKNVNERTEELIKEKAQVEEMVITLKNVLSTVEKSKEEQLHQIAEIIEKNLLPGLMRIKNAENEQARLSYIDIIKDQLLKIAGDTGTRKNPRLLSLTSSELKICSFVEAGKSSKEIADVLNLSIGTINTHRKNIRKKIGLRGKNQNLYLYLRNPESLTDPE
ncbi:MAG: LuxR C-terminal-related transcriptional regulator [Desulfonatronovibrio sp.]